ncbi:MAG: hypothetical protein C5B59_14650 [Bacteroidetes bacterium]|nr:MAG: hypothetical protein C5B59_14650 [Bacteroidota bacterium]
MDTYPIARKFLSPDSDHAIYEIIHSKFHKSTKGKVDGLGLKIFPKNGEAAFCCGFPPVSLRHNMVNYLIKIILKRLVQRK